MIMQKQLILCIQTLLLAHLALTIDVYIDSATTSPGPGLLWSPYQTLDGAIVSQLDPTQQYFVSPTTNFILFNSEPLLSKTRTYTFGTYSLILPSAQSIAFKSLTPPLVSVSQDGNYCHMLPTINVLSISTFDFSATSGAGSSLTLEGLLINIMQKPTSNKVIYTSGFDTITLKSVCFRTDGTVASTYTMSADMVYPYSFKSVITATALDLFYETLIAEANTWFEGIAGTPLSSTLTVSNITYTVAALTQPLGKTMVVASFKEFKLLNTRFVNTNLLDAALATAAAAMAAAAPTIPNFSFTTSPAAVMPYFVYGTDIEVLLIQGFSLAHITMMPSSQLVNFNNIGSVHVQDIDCTNMYMKQLTPSDSLSRFAFFEFRVTDITKVASYSTPADFIVDNVVMNNSIIDNGWLKLLGKSGSGRFFVPTVSLWKPTIISITNIMVSNANWTQGNDFIFMSIDEVGGRETQISSLIIDNITLVDSVMDIQYFFFHSIPDWDYGYGGVISWKTLSNVKVSGCNVTYFCFFDFFITFLEDGTGAVETSFYKVINVTIENNIIGIDYLQRSMPFIYNTGAYLKFYNFVVRNNTIEGNTPFIYLQTNPTDNFFFDSEFSNNIVKGTYIIFDEVLTSSLSWFNFDIDYYYPTNIAGISGGDPPTVSRAFFFSKVTFKENILSGGASILKVSPPYLYLLNCQFIGNSMDTSTAMSFQSFYPLLLSVFNYTRLYDKAEVINFLYGDETNFLRFRSREPIGVWENQTYFYAVENCKFIQNTFKSKSHHFVVSNIQSEAFGVHLLGNTFQDMMDSFDSPTPAVEISLISMVRVENNIFLNFSGESSLLSFSEFQYSMLLNITNNTFDTITGRGVISVITDTMQVLELTQNVINNGNFASTSIYVSISTMTNRKLLTFAKNAATSVSISAHQTAMAQVNFLGVNLPYGTKDIVINVLDSNFTNVQLSKSSGISQTVFDNSFLYFLGSYAVLNLTNIQFVGAKASYDNYLLSLASDSILLEKCSFSDIAMNNNKGMMKTISSSLQILNSNVEKYEGSVATDGPVFTVVSYSTEIKINISNCIFNDIKAYQSSLFYTEYAILNFTMLENVFSGLAVTQLGSVMFKNSNFTQIKLDNLDLEIGALTSENNATFLYFHNCSVNTSSGQSSFLISNIELNILAAQPGSFLVLSLTQDLPLTVANITYLGHASRILQSGTSPAITTETKYGLAVLIIGTLTLENVTVGYLGFTGTSLVSIECSQSSQPNQNSLQILNTTMNYLSLSSDAHVISVPANLDNLCPQTVLISNSLFIDISTDTNGSIINDVQERTIASAISSIAASYILNDSSFSFVKATSGSGGMFYSTASMRLISLDVFGCMFDGNYALKEGNSIWVNKAQLQFNNTAFNSENENTGEIYIESPQSITSALMTSLAPLDTNFSKILQSGPNALLIQLEPDQSVDFLAYDDANEYAFSNVASHSFKTLVFSATLAARLYNGTYLPVVDPDRNPAFYFTFRLQTVNKTSASTYTDPDKKIINGIAVDLPSKEGDVGALQIVYQSSRYTQDVNSTIRFRGCVPGEVADTVNSLCTLCSINTFSVSPDDYCRSCPEGAVCNGGADITVDPGYWRANPVAVEVYPCEDDTKCLGGQPGDACVEGYKGPLCLQCDETLEYIADATDNTACGQCTKTSTVTTAALFLTGSILYQGVMLFLTYRENTKAYLDYLKTKSLENPSKDSYMRVFNTYSQILGVVGQICAKVYDYVKISVSISIPLSGMTFSLDCLLLQHGYSVERMYKFKIVLYLLSPLVKLVLFGSGIALYLLFKRFYLRKPDPAATKKLFTYLAVALCVLILVEQPEIISILTSYISCGELIEGSGETFLVANRNISCDTSDYFYFKTLVVVPALLFWGFFTPITIIIIMYHNRKIIYDDERLRVTLGPLFVEFNPQRFYWGILIMIFKAAVFIVDTSMQVSVATKAMTIAQIFGFYNLMLFIFGNPYNDDILYKCEKLSMGAYFVTLFYSLYYLDVDQEDIGGLRGWSLVMILIVNGLTMGYMGFYFLKLVYEEYQENSEKAKEKQEKRGRAIILGGLGLQLVKAEGTVQNFEKISQKMIKMMETFKKKKAKEQKRKIQLDRIKNYLKRGTDKILTSLYLKNAINRLIAKKVDEADADSVEQLKPSPQFQTKKNNFMDDAITEISTNKIEFSPEKSKLVPVEAQNFQIEIATVNLK